MEGEVTIQQIEEGFKQIQDRICNRLQELTGQRYIEDVWSYEKGSGGGRTRVWEGNESDPLEKGGVNWSGILGDEMPESAATQLKIPAKMPFHATGVSLVIHPHNPHCPTIHMNVRYFQCGELWWFGGGIDLTPYYTSKSLVVAFHKGLKEVCDRWGHSYDELKRTCDDYFTVKHRNEMRGVSGIFFDHLRTSEKCNKSKADLWKFVQDVGNAFNDLYSPFLQKSLQQKPFSSQQRDFQMIRRGRYVEFNLVYDRGTKFGLQSNGRVESILMTLPPAVWKYNWSPKEGTPEHIMTTFFYQPQDWINMQVAPDDPMEKFGPSGEPQGKHLLPLSSLKSIWTPLSIIAIAILGGLLLKKR